MRTATTFGVPVHLIEPLGFPFNDARFRRGGMDYIDRCQYTRHLSWEKFLAQRPAGRLVLATIHGATPLPDFAFAPGDICLFGRETCGVPEDVHNMADARVRIPMRAGERSINVAQSAAIIMYEALKQLRGFY